MLREVPAQKGHSFVRESQNVKRGVNKMAEARMSKPRMSKLRMSKPRMSKSRMSKLLTPNELHPGPEFNSIPLSVF